MKVLVNIAKCSGQGRCAAVAPRVFRLNTDGYNETPVKDVPQEMETEARRGANACPERAITAAKDE